MANRIFSIKVSTSDNNSYFYDLNMMSDKTHYRKNIDESDENYLAYLANEGKTKNIVTETDKELIKIQYDDNSLILENKNWKCYDYQITRLENIKSINNSLHNIFNWMPGLRVLNPEFGSNLYKYLYNGITNYNIEQIASEIRQCIGKWEPRVDVLKIINIQENNNTENNTVQFQIIYNIPELEDNKTYTYTYTLRIGT